MRDSRAVAVAGIVGAIVVSAAAVIDWTVGGVPEEGALALAMALAHGAGYALLLPAAFAVRARHTDAFGRAGRAAATTLVGSFAAMTVGFVGLAALGEIAVVGLVAGVGFLGMFLSALALGLELWRRTDASRLAASLLLAPLPLLALLAALEALGVMSSHPAAMEAAVYLGVATLAYERLSSPDVPESPGVSARPATS